MTTAPAGPLDRETQLEVMQIFAERLARPVGLDVWTRHESGLVLVDRDPCLHCDDTLAAMRQLVRLHPAITVTPYDLDRHASRAAEAGVEMAPTTIVRSGGRSVHLVGMPLGLLFAAAIDVVCSLSSGATPLDDDARAVLGTLTAPLRLELSVAPYDPYSEHMVRLTAALATESRLVRLRVLDATQFPIAAARRGLEHVPVLTVEGRRFLGAWDVAPLVEQLRRVAAGEPEPVIRDHVYTTPFVTEADALREQATGLGRPPGGEPPEAPPALYVPGRS